MQYDYIIVGGGIIGISTAWQLQSRHPGKKILVLEKEDRLAAHQTGHNSGVIHAGIYYEPGSLKADFCNQGVSATIDFCRENNIDFEQCGKLLVATNDQELTRMDSLYERCAINEIAATRVSAEELQKMESNITGLGAIHVPVTGIVDYKQICNRMAEQFRALGGVMRLSARVLGLEENDQFVTVTTNSDVLKTGFLICCSGLNADRLATLHGLSINFRIIPFRGEFYQLSPDNNDLIEHLIYPIPDPTLPFLGVHLTRVVNGGVIVGPNAVLGWEREGYGKYNFDLQDIKDTFSFPGFWKLASRNWISGLNEFRNSIWKAGYLRQVQKYCPQLKSNDLLPYPAGVRAQAVMNDGTLVHDFLFAESSRSLHVCNAPSPAATSAIPIGQYICNKASTM